MLLIQSFVSWEITVELGAVRHCNLVAAAAAAAAAAGTTFDRPRDGSSSIYQVLLLLNRKLGNLLLLLEPLILSCITPGMTAPPARSSSFSSISVARQNLQMALETA
jgi:hypothetical protein